MLIKFTEAGTVNQDSIESIANKNISYKLRGDRCCNFASTLVGCRRELRKILSFGSDGDKALVEAFTHNFPNAIQLRCFIHFKRNAQEKLKEYGLVKSSEIDPLVDLRSCDYSK